MATRHLSSYIMTRYPTGVCLVYLLCMWQTRAAPTLQSLQSKLAIVEIQYQGLLGILAKRTEVTEHLSAELEGIRQQLNATVTETRSSLAQTQQRSLALEVFNSASSRIDDIRRSLLIEKEQRFGLENSFSEVKSSVLDMLTNTDKKWMDAISAFEVKNNLLQAHFDDIVKKSDEKWSKAIGAIEDRNIKIQADFDKQMIKFQAEWNSLKEKVDSTDSKIKADFRQIKVELNAQQSPLKSRLSKLEDNIACQADCPMGSEKFQCKCYKIHTKVVKFSESQRICKEAGGDLLMPKTSEEREFAKGLIRKSKTMIWLGLHRDDTFSDWIYTDDAKMEDYIGWQAVFGKLNYSSAYRCVSVNRGGYLRSWSNKMCSNLRLRMICQTSLI